MQWILATAPGLPTARPGRYVLPIQKITPPGVPFAVSLHRWPRENFPFPFIVRHLVEGDVEAARLLRYVTRMTEKFRSCCNGRRPAPEPSSSLKKTTSSSQTISTLQIRCFRSKGQAQIAPTRSIFSRFHE